MSPLYLRRLGAALAAILVLLALAWLRDRPAQDPALAPEGLTQSADRIEVSGPEGTLDLRKQGGSWSAVAPAYPADSARVQDLLERLPGARLSEPLTEDPERYALFGFEASTPTRVKVFAGASTAVDVYIGKDGTDYPSAYVRVPGKPGVLSARGVSPADFNRPPGEWLDKAVLAGAKDSVSQVKVKGAKGAWTLRRSSGAWTVDGKAVPADAEQRGIAAVLEAATNLRAETVLDAAAAPPRGTLGLDKPDLLVEVVSGAGTGTYRVGKQDKDGRRYVERAGEARVYFLVADWKLSGIRKTAGEILK